jgi:hypothetical protein
VAAELNVRAVCATDPTYGVTTDAVIADPLLAGAVHDTTADPFPGTADTFVGATGAPTVTAAVAADCGPVPLPFLAATVNVYVVAFVSPVIVCDVAAELNVRAVCATDPTYGVTTDAVIADPLLAGAVHDTTADPFPGTPTTPVGATGAPTVTAPDATDGGPVPLAFFAATLNTYVVPLVSPVIVWDVAAELNVRAGWTVNPTYGVTTYAVIPDPLSAGAVHDTTADPFPGTPTTPVGATGAPTVTDPDATDCGPAPLAFFAATLNTYVVPFVSPVIVCDVAAELNVLAGWTVNPTYGVTTYAVIPDPLFAGAVHDTTADPFPGTPTTPVGAAGAPLAARRTSATEGVDATFVVVRTA